MAFPTIAHARFWAVYDELVRTSELVIDRPKDQPHPQRPWLIYPLDYGYLAGTTAGDGAGIDVWVGSLPTGGVTGIACTVDPYKRDTEIKVLLRCGDHDLALIDHFLNSVAGLPCLLIKRK
jgi:inorganic pyrophosphatase